MDSLVVAPCDHEAAKYAVMHWHYSQAMPASKLVKYGVWENGQFIGAVTFSRGASVPLYATMQQKYGLDITQWAELTRVAMTNHTCEVTRVLSEAIRQLRAANPGLRLLISFADPNQGHHGGIYQAGNWIYVGTTQLKGKYDYWWKGRWRVERTIRAQLRPDEIARLPKRASGGKHRYLYPLDKAMRRKIAPLALPYPQRADEGGHEWTR